MPGNQQQFSHSGSVYQTVVSTECDSCGALKARTGAAWPGLVKVTDSRLAATSDTGVPAPPPFKSHRQAAPAESDVSIGPLLTGIAMMVLMRRHRC